MSINPQFAGGPLVTETPEQLAEREREEARNRLLEIQGFQPEEARAALGGIGELDPEEGLLRAEQARGREIAERDGDPEALLAGLEQDYNTFGQVREGDETREKNPSFSPQCEYAPLIEQFGREGHISPEEVRQLIEQRINGENYEQVIQICIPGPEEQKELIASIAYLESPTHMRNSEQEIQRNFGDMFGAFQKGEGDAQVWISSSAEDAFHELCGHYIGNPGNEAEGRNQMNLALQMTANALYERVQIGLDSSNRESCERAFRSAHNELLPNSERFAALAQISQIINTSIGAAGGRSIALQRAQEQRILEATGLNDAFLEAQAAAQRAERQNNQEAQRVAEARIQEIISQAEKISGTSIGSFDTAIEVGGESPQSMNT